MPCVTFGSACYTEKVKITGLGAQQKNPDRINVFVDGAYSFSLLTAQVVDLGVKVGREYTDEELAELKQEAQFGKVYMRALEYCLMRPRSSREVADYLYKKTRLQHVHSRKTGEVREQPGVPESVTARVSALLREKGYIDDERFATFWVESRHQRKGISRRKLQAELQAKGVSSAIIAQVLQETERSDETELQKIIAKKRARYDDRQKFIQYLMRQGFRYDDVLAALDDSDD